MNTNNSQIMTQALLEIKKLKAELKTYREEKNTEIAIIGMGCKFPGGANSPEAYWDLIINGIDAVDYVPESRWNREVFYSPSNQVGKVYTDQGGFIDHVDKFDPVFFGISPREAEYMDPQHRILLEVCWESMENAGIVINHNNEPNNTGVFIGLTTNDYLSDIIERHGHDKINAFYGIGNAHNGASGRISHTFGFSGPSMTVDTACSSSLTSVHLACQSLINKECNMAIAGGVNVLLNPTNSIITAQAKMLSHEGRCKTFDDSADGYVRSEGCGVIVLMRLEDAVKQNKNILAVIKGSGVNHNAVSSSISVPNMHAQSTLIKNVLEKANILPKDVSYIEAHGTGTNLGDPIELRALQNVFSDSHNKDNPLYIGSVKSNIGHTESAAGIAGIIKSVLCLRKKIIPGNIHYKVPNTNFDWDELPFVVPVESQKWKKKEGRNRLVGVSSFGVSGTNAHVLMEEFIQEEKEIISTEEMPSWVFTVSAKTKTALEESKRQMIQFLSTERFDSLKDLCLSSVLGRSHFEYRYAKKVNSLEDLKAELSKDWTSLPKLISNKKINFNCTGKKEGLKMYVNDLFQNKSSFTKCFQEVENVFEKFYAYKLSDSINDLQDDLTQIGVVCMEYCIAQMWIELGVTPTAITGIGLGLFSAAIIAGCFSLEDGIRLLQSDFDSIQKIHLKPSRIQLQTPTNELISLDEIQSADFWKHTIKTSYQVSSNLEDEIYSFSIGIGEEPNGINDLNQKIVDLFLIGVDLSFDKVFEEKYDHVCLPNYPFVKERYWLEGKTDRLVKNKIHPFCEDRLLYAKDPNVQIVENCIDFTDVKDHCIHNEVTVPGSLFVEILLAMSNFNSVKDTSSISLKNISFSDTVLLKDQKEMTLQTVIEQQELNSTISIFYTSNDGELKLCSSGLITNSEVSSDFDAQKFSCTGEEYLGADIYSKLKEYGYDYGSTYQGIEKLFIDGNTIVGTIKIPEAIVDEYKKYIFHPALLDACLQLGGAELIRRENQVTYVPVFIGNCVVYKEGFNGLKCHVELRDNVKSSTISADYHIYNELNQPIAIMTNVLFRQLDKKPDLALRKKFYSTDWDVVNLNPRVKKNSHKKLLLSLGAKNNRIIHSVLNQESVDFLEVHTVDEFKDFWKENDLSVDQIIIDFINFEEQILEAARMEERILIIQTIAKEILKNSYNKIPELVILTSLGSEIQLAGKIDYQNELFALTTILNQEEPNFKTRIIAIDPKDNTNQLCGLLCSQFDTLEERLVIKENVIYGQRLKEAEQENLNLNKPYKLKIDEPGSLSELEVQVIEKTPPGLNEVGLSVVASGVNFKEVLYALGALPMPKGEAGSFEFGFECTGIVSSVGQNVQDINIGDEVVAVIAPGSLGSYTVVNKNFVFPKPKELSFEEAATLPIVFITAYYALMNLAQINKNSKVLIHAAAGGVGLAAVQIAQLMEAEIYATASVPKHSVLKENGLSFIYNSRTLDFVDQIKEDMNAEGLDVVLNSFSGEFIFKSLDLVKNKGCFIEIGKVSRETKDRIKELRPDIAYHNFDVGEIAAIDPELIRSIFANVLEKMQTKALKPIQYSAYSMAEVERAFSTFAKGKNIGKVVITHHQNKDIPLFYPEEYFVVTGGNGGLGANLLKWMFKKGARNFIVLSRSGKEDVIGLHKDLIAKGAIIRYEIVDVSNEDSVKKFFNKISHEKCNLRGIFHTAGVLNDKQVINQTDEDVRFVLNPKVKGTMYLDKYSRPFNLKHFVCFSSIASIFGTIGQFSYAGANGAMDTILYNRRCNGLPATRLNWGPFADVGMASNLNIQSDGVVKLSVTEDFDAIEIAIREKITQLCIADINWKQLADSSNYYRKSTLLAAVRKEVKVVDKIEIDKTFVIPHNINELIEQNIKSVLGLPIHYEISRTQSLFDYGLDSLMAIELKNRIEKITEQEIASTFLFNHPALDDITAYFESKTKKSHATSDLDSLSTLLDQELKELE